MSLTAYERETILICNDDQDYWEVSSRQRKVISKLLRLDVFDELDREVTDKGTIIYVKGTLPFKNISIRKVRQLTDAQREKMSKLAKENLVQE